MNLATVVHRLDLSASLSEGHKLSIDDQIQLWRLFQLYGIVVCPGGKAGELRRLLAALPTQDVFPADRLHPLYCAYRVIVNTQIAPS